MTLPSLFAVIVGLLIFGQWGFFYATRQIPELKTEPIRIAFHLAAELVTAIALIVGGVGLLTQQGWGREVYLIAIGMLFYTAIVSPGYFAQKRVWSVVVMFAVLMILALVSVAAVISS